MLKHLLPTLLLAASFSVAAIAQPVNDNCDEAEVLPGAGMYSFTTIDATTDGPDHPNCPSSGTTPAVTYNDVWYSFTPNWTGHALFSLCGTANFDSKIVVYVGGAACPVTDGQVLACNEDAGGCANSTSEIDFPVTTGQTYLLRLGGYGDGVAVPAEGSGTFIVEEYIFNGPPNDDCVNAIEIFMDSDDSITVDYTNVDAINDSPEHLLQDCFATSEPFVYDNIWFKWTATFTGAVDISTCGTVNYDSRLAVYGPGATCPPSTDLLVACSDDGMDENFMECPDYTSHDRFSVVQGGNYLISMGGWSPGDVGSGYFTFKKADLYIPPSNDNCADASLAYVITSVQADDFDVLFNGNTQTASYTDSTSRPTCRETGEFWDVWYTFNSGFNTALELRFNITEPADADYIIDLFSDCGTADTSAATFCFDTDVSTATYYVYQLPNFPGTPTEYLMRVSSRIMSYLTGNFWFQLVGEPYSSVNEPALTNFRLYPNPAQSQFSIDFGLPASAWGSWEVLNVLGQSLFMSGERQFPTGQSRLDYSLEKMSPGVYFFRLAMDGKEKTVRFVKQ